MSLVDVLPGQFKLFEQKPTFFELALMRENGKPSLNELIEVAKKWSTIWLRKYAKKLPEEIRQEIDQEIMLWAVETHPSLDPERNWKGFANIKARGIVQDYIKLSLGWSREMKRQALVVADGEVANDIDLILTLEGFSNSQEHELHPVNWDLLARLARSDRALHAFVRWALLEQTINDIAPTFGVTFQRIFMLVADVQARFKTPTCRWKPEFKQAVYALGWSEYFDLKHEDQSIVYGFPIGWREMPVDFEDMAPEIDIESVDEAAQMTFDGLCET